MDDKVLRLLKVFDTFTEAQKKEFLDSLQQVETGKLHEWVRRKEQGVVMGPLGGGCPYCGR